MDSGLLQSRALTATVLAGVAWKVGRVHDPITVLKEGLLAPSQSGLRPNYREGAPINRNWVAIYRLPPIRARPSFPLSQALSSGSFCKPFILLQQRADRMKTTITEN